MSGKRAKPTANEYVFELSGYILNCAEMAVSPRGNPRYCALRFMEVLQKVIDLPEYAECVQKDPYLMVLKGKLSKVPMERDQMEEMRKVLQDLLIEYAGEASKRV
jgi:hypothetical protein